MSWVLPILRFPSPRSAGRGRVLSRKTKCVNAFMKTEPDTRPGVTTRTVAVVWRLAFGFATLRGAAGTAELAAPGRRGAPFRDSLSHICRSQYVTESWWVLPGIQYAVSRHCRRHCPDAVTRVEEVPSYSLISPR